MTLNGRNSVSQTFVQFYKFKYRSNPYLIEYKYVQSQLSNCTIIFSL